MKPDRSLLREWPTLVVGLLVLLFALSMLWDNSAPLSPLENRLVGEWSVSEDPAGITRTFSPDRTFTTSNGQFAGVWHIQDGRLTVTYSVPWELPHDLSIPSIQLAHEQFRRSRKQYLCTWDIEVSDNGQEHILSHPVDDLHPDGEWHWTRVAVDERE